VYSFKGPTANSALEEKAWDFDKFDIVYTYPSSASSEELAVRQAAEALKALVTTRDAGAARRSQCIESDLLNTAVFPRRLGQTERS
jgi:hypothetical protein